MRRVLLTVALVAVLAGCTSGGGVETASSESKASKVNAMLESPPGSDVQPTGEVRDYTLYVSRMPAHEIYPGATMAMWGFGFADDGSDASVPGPILRVVEGDTVRVTLVALFGGFNHTLHFHGQNVPYGMDGVPYLTQDPVEASEQFTYEFVAKPAGTYWYHCHVDATHHIDMGMYGVLIVDPQDPADDPTYSSNAEFVMVLDDMDRYHVEAGQPPSTSIPQGGDYYSTRDYAERTANDAVSRNPTVDEGLKTQNNTVRPTRDWYPITYAPYTATYNTYVINGVSFPYTETLVVNEGDIARIRLVNAGNVVFAMHLHGHHALVTHKDGVLLEAPYWVDVVAIAPGERYDLYVKMDNPGLWDFHDHIGGHVHNDNIFPGGAMTMLCYASIDGCTEGGGHGGHGGASGRHLKWTGRELP